MAPIDRNCSPGQVDVNTASTSELSRALKISEPTALRVIRDNRPWQRSVDLISVPGIGPQKLQLLVTAACATPTVLPPATPLACLTNTNAVDLQSATEQQIVQRTGLDTPTVRRLIAARPLPQNLAQVVAPRVPGLSLPIAQKLVSSLSVCVTPAPFVFASTTYRWASAQFGGAVSPVTDSRYALFIPPARVNSTSGAWASATILAPIENVLPAADFHIFGSWTPFVAIQLPAPPNSAGVDDLVVAHVVDADDSSYSLGSGTAERATASGPVVVAPARSLSEFRSYQFGSCDDPYRLSSPFVCPGASGHSDDLMETLQEEQARRWAAASTAPKTDCQVSSLRVITTGFVDGALTCKGKLDGQQGVWTFDNTTDNLVGAISSFGTISGAVFDTNTMTGASADTDIARRDTGWATGAVADELAEAGYVAPGSQLTIRKNAGEAETTLNASADLPLSALWLMVQQSIAVADLITAEATKDEKVKAQAEMAVCAAEIALINGPDIAANVASCMTAALLAVVEKAVSRLAASSLKTKVASGLEAAKAGLKKFLIYFDVAVSALKVVSGRDLKVTMRVLPPPPPALPGGLDSLNGLTGDGTFIARAEDGQAFLVFKDHKTATPIRTEGLFNCLVLSRYVLDHVLISGANSGQVLLLPGDKTVDVTLTGLSCDPSGPHWTYTGIRQGGNVPDNVILKNPDWISRKSWFIDGDGTIAHIGDGGTYKCLVRTYPVIYNVPENLAAQWPPTVDDNGAVQEARCS